MSKFPLEPKLARLLLYSHQSKCMSEILNIVACLSTDNIFNLSNLDRNDEKMAEVKSNQARFYKQEGDCLTLLEVYRAFSKYNKDVEKQRNFCRENNLNWRSLKNALTIRKQLREIGLVLGIYVYFCRMFIFFVRLFF